MSTVVAVVLMLLAQESQVRLRAGQEKLKVRDFDGAIPEFEKCLDLNPEEYNAHFGLGTCWWEKDDYKKARDHFAKVVAIVEKANPNAPLPGVRQKLLGCALLLEEFDAAIAEATRLIAIQSTAEYFYARALARQRKGDAPGALEDCAAALREDALLTKARTLKAELLLAQGDDRSAMDTYAASIRAKPSDPTAYLARGCAYYRQERWVEASTDLESARRLFVGQNSDLEIQAYAIALERLARQRQGLPPAGADAAKAFAKRLKELEKDPKKNHLLALPLHLAGEASEDTLIQAAGAATARKAQARCEAWFFIGERRLLEGHLPGARHAFTRAVEGGATGIFEDDLARARLKMLGQ